MKKPKPKKIRKVWAIKPKTRIRPSRRGEIRDRIGRKEAKDGLSGGF